MSVLDAGMGGLPSGPAALRRKTRRRRERRTRAVMLLKDFVLALQERGPRHSRDALLGARRPVARQSLAVLPALVLVKKTYVVVPFERPARNDWSWRNARVQADAVLAVLDVPLTFGSDSLADASSGAHEEGGLDAAGCTANLRWNNDDAALGTQDAAIIA